MPSIIVPQQHREQSIVVTLKHPLLQNYSPICFTMKRPQACSCRYRVSCGSLSFFCLMIVLEPRFFVGAFLVSKHHPTTERQSFLSLSQTLRINILESAEESDRHRSKSWTPLQSWCHVGFHYQKKGSLEPLQTSATNLYASPTSSSESSSSASYMTSPSFLPTTASFPQSFLPKRTSSPRPAFLSTNRRFSSSPAYAASSTSIEEENGLSPCVIKVIGVGGGGCNAIDRMMDTTLMTNPSSNRNRIDYWALNTDVQVLGRSQARGANILTLGTSVTRGLGAGGDPDAGRMAAEESRQYIRPMVEGCDLCFITAGMGGGTGSGAAPVVARMAKEMGCLTIAIVTKPFAFEGKRRMNQALDAIKELRKYVDTIIVVSNDRLLEIIPDDTPLDRAFCVADDILRQGVIGITDIIVQPGLVNVDFADVRAIMSNAGTALMGIGIGSGDNAAEDAALAAISSPLLDTTIDNAKGVVFNISGGPRLTLNEVNKAAKLIYKFVAPDANVIFGALVDDALGDSISITVLAAGFDDDE
jgi:cell division protein FtsZ